MKPPKTMNNLSEIEELTAKNVHLQLPAAGAATCWLRSNRSSPLNLRGRRPLRSMLHNVRLFAAARRELRRLRRGIQEPRN